MNVAKYNIKEPPGKKSTILIKSKERFRNCWEPRYQNQKNCYSLNSALERLTQNASLKVSINLSIPVYPSPQPQYFPILWVGGGFGQSHHVNMPQRKKYCFHDFTFHSILFSGLQSGNHNIIFYFACVLLLARSHSEFNENRGRDESMWDHLSLHRRRMFHIARACIYLFICYENDHIIVVFFSVSWGLNV